jgi:gluconolactonase
MKNIYALAITLTVLTTSCLAQPASTTEPIVRKGEVTKYVFDHSRIFPGTVRNYWVYVPAEYDPNKPACLFVDQDSIQFNIPAVFDRLIASGKIPVTIAVFVAPGKVPARSTQALDRFNRSYEFDTLSDSYVNFLLDELLPEVEAKTTADGRPIHISHDANDRAIGGSSSGAVAAFNAAWNRPDSFSRVFSAIGSYTNLRGANVYPLLVRKFEPKPIRIFLQDGSADHNHYAGDWWMANQELERALTYAGYEVNHVWGTGDHDHKQADQIFPDAIQWLWHDWPAPVKAGLGSEQLQQILIPGQGWQLVADGLRGADGPAADESGVVYFNDGKSGGIKRIDADGKITDFVADSHHGAGQAFGPDYLLYAVATSSGQIIAHLRVDPRAELMNRSRVIADGIPHGNDLTITATGGIYVTDDPPKGGDSGNVWYIGPKGDKRIVDTGLKFPNGIALSPDQSLLYVDDYRSHWVYSYEVQSDGSLAFKQKFYDLYVPDSADDAGADGMRVDRDGRLYVSTRVGIQVCDQAGRVICIIPTPNGRVSNLCFGGAAFDVLFATCGDRIYARKVKVHGALSFQPPIKPAPPKL